MLSTRNNMITIMCHTTSRWATKCGYIAKGVLHWTPLQASPALIRVVHHHQVCREQCLRAQYSTIPWSAPNIQCGLPSSLLPTSTGHLWHYRTTHTNRVKPRLHGTSHHRLYHGHANQEHSSTADPTVSGCQSWPTPAPRKVVHQGPSSAEISSSHDGT